MVILPQHLTGMDVTHIVTVWCKFHTLAVLYYVCCAKQTVKFLYAYEHFTLNKDIGTHITYIYII
jgi:hypothetical protein